MPCGARGVLVGGGHEGISKVGVEGVNQAFAAMAAEAAAGAVVLVRRRLDLSLAGQQGPQATSAIGGSKSFGRNRSLNRCRMRELGLLVRR